MPEELSYTKTHEWVRTNGGEVLVGITDFAQEQLGDLTFVELPEVGDVLDAGFEMGSVESVKAASELYSPVSGEVVAVNELLESEPGLVNEDPYGDGWMVRIKMSTEPEGLLSADDYQALTEA
ncbi:MAG: glycine cleavage system protein GcvH [Desulfovibrio sp.]|nr:MAG: glycine cleavage system protein GcvH [Desulfovibrio sp.]